MMTSTTIRLLLKHLTTDHEVDLFQIHSDSRISPFALAMAVAELLELEIVTVSERSIKLQQDGLEKILQNRLMLYRAESHAWKAIPHSFLPGHRRQYFDMRKASEALSEQLKLVDKP